MSGNRRRRFPGERTHLETAWKRHVHPNRAGARKRQAVERPGRVRCGEIANIPAARGFLWLAAILGQALQTARLSAVLPVNGRSGGIRTHDLLTPSQTRYLGCATLRPVWKIGQGGGGYNAAPRRRSARAAQPAYGSGRRTAKPVADLFQTLDQAGQARPLKGDPVRRLRRFGLGIGDGRIDGAGRVSDRRSGRPARSGLPGRDAFRRRFRPAQHRRFGRCARAFRRRRPGRGATCLRRPAPVPRRRTPGRPRKRRRYRLRARVSGRP